MSEFKVGDRVRIREDLSVYEEYNGTFVINSMLDYRGKIATIKRESYDRYNIDLDEQKWDWTKEMFELIKTQEQQKIEQLEQRIEKLEKCVMGEQKPIAKLFTLDRKEPLEIILGESNEETKPSLLTEDERVILRNLDKKWKWIARDEEGCLYVYNKNKPYKFVDMWKNGVTSCDCEIFAHLFQFIKWNDKEPYNIEELLKGECGNE